MRDRIPFSRPSIPSHAADAIARSLSAPSLAGNGPLTALCHDLIGRAVPGGRAFLTTSCTDALEMAALVLGLQPGDEVVMPSWTFPSTANAVALRGAVPVFVDVAPGTLNIDPARVEEAVTARTRAVICVHYAGIGCEMERLRALCGAHGLALIEDAAQGYGATWNGVPLGGWGDLGAFSFHGTKNISSGEGGALVVNRSDLVPAAEIAWEKGTDRLRFQRGEVSVYEWCGLGSSFLPSELTAALLSEQLRVAEAVTQARRSAWARYAELIAQADPGPSVRLPMVPEAARHNGHIFAIRVDDAAMRERIIVHLEAQGIETRTHYHPLHLSTAGRRYGRTVGSLPVTQAAADDLLRLPLDAVITPAEQERVVGALVDEVRRTNERRSYRAAAAAAAASSFETLTLSGDVVRDCDVAGDYPPAHVVRARALQIWPRREWSDDALVAFPVSDLVLTSSFVSIDPLGKRMFLNQSYRNIEQLFPNRFQTDGTHFSLTTNPVPLSGRYVVLGGPFDGVWYHWLFNWCPRLLLLRDLRPDLLASHDVRFIVHPNALEGQFRAVLDTFGIARERFVAIDSLRDYRIEQATLVSFLDQQKLYPDTIRAFADHLLEAWDLIDEPESTGIFTSRQALTPPKRRISNFEEIEPVLAAFSLQVVDCGALSAREQARIFRAARVVVGAHGSDLSNLLFCRPGTKVLVLESALSITSDAHLGLKYLCEVLELDYSVMETPTDTYGGAKRPPASVVNRDYVVDPTSFANELQNIYKNQTLKNANSAKYDMGIYLKNIGSKITKIFDR